MVAKGLGAGRGARMVAAVAHMSGVFPKLSRALASAPALSSSLTLSTFPAATARASALKPWAGSLASNETMLFYWVGIPSGDTRVYCVAINVPVCIYMLYESMQAAVQ